MAADFPVPEKKDQKIRFTLDVTASISEGIVNKIDFKMNLNPKERLIGIDEHLSGYKELLAIFDEIGKALGEINERTLMYNRITGFEQDSYDKLFQKGYEENIRPSFGKIDRIHYTHKSPGVANVSYTDTYNGDRKPT